MDIQLSTVTLFLLILYYSILIDHVRAPNTLAESTEAIPPPSQDPISNSKPSLPVVIAFLSILFCLTLTLLLYAKFCRTRTSSLDTTTDQIQINKRVVESLPSFRFSWLRGSREGLECAVCLAKFQDIEILRLLPKCKHAFHVDCIDIWLEKHSTCPLCRQTVGPDDFSQLPYSDSLRFLWNVNERDLLRRESSVIELHVEREENFHGSSRFSISLRRLCDKELVPIQHESIMDMVFDDREGIKKELALHKLNHRIVVSDVVYKNRWSNVSSSDLMFLNSEMVSDASTAIFSSLDSGRSCEQKCSKEIKQIEHECSQTGTAFKQIYGFTTNDLKANDKRSMSEIIVHPRFNEFGNTDTSYPAVAPNNVDEKLKGVWLEIARKTIRWFANRQQTRLPYSQ